MTVASKDELLSRTVTATLQRNAAEFPDDLAVRDAERALTHQELLREASRLAGGLRSLGVEPGHRVLLMLDNHLDYVLSWLAVSWTGAVEVPVNTAYRGRILSYLIEDSRSSTIIIDARYLERLGEVLGDNPDLATIVVRGDEGHSALPEERKVVPFEQIRSGEAIAAAPCNPWDLIAIMYTSGTTGVSKGVMVTHGQAYAYSTPEYWGAATREDVSLVTLPLFHVGGQWAGVYNALLGGGSAVVVARFSATRYWDDVRHYGCTYTLMLGSMAVFLNNQDRKPDDAINTMSRALMVPVIPEVRQFEERFGVAIGSAFGMTETASPLFSSFGTAEAGCCGYLRSDYEARVVDDDDLEVAADVVGELVLRAKDPWAIMAGYLNKPEATVEAWRNLWFHTGDLVRKTEDGRFWFVDRKKDAIRRRGENVSSYEVEAEISALEEVAECAVVGVPSESTEDEIKAVVILAEGATLEPAEMIRRLAARLPYFMVPRYVEFVQDLPRTATAKVQKVELRTYGVTPQTWDRVAAGVEVRRE